MPAPSRWCRVLVLGHVPSQDNEAGLRARDQPALPAALSLLERRLLTSQDAADRFTTVDACYCPATRRHVDSARAFCAALQLPEPVVDPRLDNVDYGHHKGRPVHDTPAATQHIDRPYAGGTSWSHVLQNWAHFAQSALRAHPGSTVLLVGQSGAAARMLEILCRGRSAPDVLADPQLDVPFLNAGFVPQEWTYRW